ncbi:hypothetical protein [Streptomyces sp. FBKL.4005]|uniref:hypothetical protein n=1 Tax=Streptomyces sp. FBKL.4005 TaxID=2015515 RepID=UPI00117EF612|nr:hypothetical protein [Streptomyces sp. FBKL.4005]
MDLLQEQQQIRERWDLEELWGLIATLVALLSEVENPEGVAERNLGTVFSCEPSIAVFSVANIDWEGPPLRLAKNCLIGVLDESFASSLEEIGGRASAAVSLVKEYAEQQSHRRPLIGFAAMVPGQRTEAFSQAQRSLELIIDLAILLVPKKQEHALYSVRGASNRPGVRGLTLDRTVIHQAMKASGDGSDLSCEPLISDALGVFKPSFWYSAERVPLERLPCDDKLAHAVNKCLEGKTNITRRIQVAARWFSESFWSIVNDDSALAAGVALDSLVGARSGLPGRAMKERFAFLEAVPRDRPLRAREYDAIYSARSAIAHGGESPRVREGNFVREMQNAVTWAAWRLLAAEREFNLRDNKDLEALFDGLRWGTRSWGSSER